MIRQSAVDHPTPGTTPGPEPEFIVLRLSGALIDWAREALTEWDRVYPEGDSWDAEVEAAQGMAQVLKQLLAAAAPGEAIEESGR